MATRTMDRGATGTGRIYYSVEAERQARRERNRSIVVATIVGLTIGGILAATMGPGLMPRRQKSMREKIVDGVSETTSDSLKKLEHQYNSLKDQVDKMMSSVRG